MSHEDVDRQIQLRVIRAQAADFRAIVAIAVAADGPGQPALVQLFDSLDAVDSALAAVIDRMVVAQAVDDAA